ncbi:unnamed protein product [Haemonchus placei]|uniref:CCHC-type domain-containing protein n=1 Tax=Haemonchus placei TaxID=6290 RepID=A0A0N4VSI5_HAEPC|nr:unnamed protein product [Haemonchus placei]
MPTTRSQSSLVPVASSDSGSSSSSSSPSPPALTGTGAAAPNREHVAPLDVGAGAPASASYPFRSTALTATLDESLSRLDDSAVLHAADVKQLRDATSAAITRVWKEATSQTSALAQKINEGNTSLSRKLNESFTAVGSRLDALPTVAMLGLDPQTPRITPFSGSSEEGAQFSVWLRRLEDVIRMRPSPLTSEQKANFLIGHLDGVALASHLRAFFESPQQKYKLSSCRQEPGESSATFANRVLNLVRAATAGQDAATQKDRVLEEFVARLRGDIRYFVKLDNPSTFEQAVTKAQMVEQLLSEATAERLITPAQPVPAVNALDSEVSSRNQPFNRFNNRGKYHRNFRRFDNNQRRRFQGNATPQQETPVRPGRCYNCGRTSHLAYQCTAPVMNQPTRRKNRPVQNSTYALSNRRSYQPPPPSRRDNAPLMSCGVPSSHAAPQDDPDLLAAQQRIADLSLTVGQTQAELNQSRARIAALIQRNEDLAKVAYDCKTSSSPSAARSPSVHSLFLCCLALICVSSVSASADAWLCPSENPTNIFFVPSAFNCSRLLPNVTKQLQSVSLHVYRPNTKQYSSPAFLCKVVRHSVLYSVSFFGARTENHEETLLPVSAEECKLMSRHKRCVHGELSLHGSVWRTSNVLDFEFPVAPFGCCVDHTQAVHNCYLLETTVHTRHGEEVPDSAAGDLRSCRYKDGACILPDGSVVIWTPDQEEGCRFTPVTKMRGFSMGDVWISESKEFALSWSENSQVVYDCLKQLTITDQGYAIAVVRRAARAVDAGLVTTNQLSAQLLAVEGSVQDAVSALFVHAVQALCDRTNVLAVALQAALQANPTITMRNLIGRNDLVATHLGNGFVQVRRCVQVPPSTIVFQAFNETCFAYPQVKIRLSSGSIWQAFLNPFTGVIVSRAPRIDCADVTPLVLSANSSLVQFFPVSGQLTPVPAHQVLSVASFPPWDTLSFSPKLTIFHNLILTNFSEIVSDSRFQEMWTVRDQEKLMGHVAQIHHSTGSPSSADSFVGPLRSLWPFSLPSPFEIWVACCCAIVSLGVIKFVLITYVGISYPGLLPLIKRMYGTTASPGTPPVSRTPPNSPVKGQVVAMHPIIPLDLGISKVDIDVQNAWPPRASIVPIQVLSFEADRKFFVTQIPVRVNGLRLLALIDTGAGITVASQSLLSLLGIFKLDACVVPSAIGMAGIPVKFVGSAIVNLQIGSELLKQTVHFTEGQCVPAQADSYDLILGNDVLRRLPAWSLDYDNRLFHVGSDQVQIFAGSLAVPSSDRQKGATVRVSETTVLPPGTETLVPCYVADSPKDATLCTASCEVGGSGSLYVAPTVLLSSKPHLLVTNPTTVSQLVYRDQRLADGVVLDEAEDGTLSEPLPCF